MRRDVVPVDVLPQAGARRHVHVAVVISTSRRQAFTIALFADGFDLGHSLRGLQDPATRSLVFLLPLPDEAHAVRSRTIEDRRPAGPKDGK